MNRCKRSPNRIKPTKKSVKSLYAICINSLTKHMSLCQKNECKLSHIDAVKELMDSENNPFENLLSPILDEIAEVFSNSNRGNCNFRLHGFYNEKFSESPNEISLFLRKLMLTQYCQKFSLKNIDGDQAMSLLHFASVKCPDLKKLIFWNNIKISMTNCFPLISKFTKLQVLHVVASGFLYIPKEIDCLFITLGGNCPDLRDLQLIHKNAKLFLYTMVSEDGIRGLCVIGKCKLIHTLLLDEYNIVTEKVIQIVIENLPALRIFNHRFTVRALANLHRKALGKKPYILPEFALSNLGVYIGCDTKDRTNLTTTMEDCKLAVAVCPFITKVYVRYLGFELLDDDFLFLHKIKSLTNLHMKTCSFFTKQNTVIGLARLFKSVGSSLTFLKLDSFPKVDICDIIEFCPNLRSINLTCITYDDGTTKHRKKKNFLLKKLEMLYFWSNRECANFETEILSILLSSPSLY
uniref:Uncharacterized protein n=1 Tax=Daphnia galeata TaxID=27404 RepID=A0A8J2RRN0_9CRUS|nr:unnamed protein product [Daphnia galeata]